MSLRQTDKLAIDKWNNEQWGRFGRTVPKLFATAPETWDVGVHDAPFFGKTISPPTQLVHPVHRFDARPTANRGKWYIRCTVSANSSPQEGQNGASGAPFRKLRTFKRRKMVYAMHHFARHEIAESRKWRIRRTILTRLGLKTLQNGVRSAPFWPSWGNRIRKTVHVVHHSGSCNPNKRNEWCLRCTILAAIPLRIRNNGTPRAPF